MNDNLREKKEREKGDSIYSNFREQGIKQAILLSPQPFGLKKLCPIKDMLIIELE
jgi:hypothetical protein